MEIIETFNHCFRVIDAYGNIIKTFSEYENAVKFVKLFDYI